MGQFLTLIANNTEISEIIRMMIPEVIIIEPKLADIMVLIGNTISVPDPIKPVPVRMVITNANIGIRPLAFRSISLSRSNSKSYLVFVRSKINLFFS